MSPKGGARPGSGPNRRLDNRQVLSISFDEPTLTKLRYWCQRLQISRSEAVRRIVAETRLPTPNDLPKGENDDHDPGNGPCERP